VQGQKYGNNFLFIYINALTVNRALSSIISYPIIGILKHVFTVAASEGIMSLNLEKTLNLFSVIY
jgi:hypothetical protein